jgi:hypothetical protein
VTVIGRAGSVLLIAMVAACRSATTPAGTPSIVPSVPSATAAATPGGSGGGSECTPSTAGSDRWRLAESTADTSDQSDARIALCVGGRAGPAITFTGACEWSDDRQVLRAIVGGIEEGELDGWAVSLWLGQGSPGVVLFGPDGVTYRPDAPTVVTTADGVSRTVPARLRTAGQAAPPLAKEVDVQVAWRCEVPPPPKPGLAAGQGTLFVDSVLGGPWTGEIDCHWALVDGRPEVTRVDSTTDAIKLGDRELGVGLDRGVTFDGDLVFRIHVTEGPDNVEYESPRNVTTVALADDHSAGSVRFVQLGPLEPSPLTLDGTPSTSRIDGIFEWACGPPPASPRPWDGGAIDVDGRFVDVPATLELDAPLAVRLEGINRCVADPRQDYPYIEFVDARFEWGDETIRLRWRGGLYLLRTVGDRIVGEYESTQEWPLQDVGTVVRNPLGRITFRDTDPAWQPFLGDAGPRELLGTLEVSCPAA